MNGMNRELSRTGGSRGLGRLYIVEWGGELEAATEPPACSMEPKPLWCLWLPGGANTIDASLCGLNDPAMHGRPLAICGALCVAGQTIRYRLLLNSILH